MATRANSPSTSASSGDPGPSGRRPGRPAGGRAFERRDVVEAALSAIAAGGFAGLSMRGVARDLGASLATVQRHFPTKDELWRGAIDDFLDKFDEHALTGAQGGAVLVEVIAQLLGRAREYPGLIAALVTDRSPGFEERTAYLAKRLAERNAGVRADIERLQGSGVVRPVDIRAVMMLLHLGVGMMSSAAPATQALYGYDLDDADERDRLARELADILNFGLFGRPSD